MEQAAGAGSSSRRGDKLRQRFAEVRAAGAREDPTIAGLRYQDLRDTAVTTLAEAGCTMVERSELPGGYGRSNRRSGAVIHRRRWNSRRTKRPKGRTASDPQVGQAPRVACQGLETLVPREGLEPPTP